MKELFTCIQSTFIHLRINAFPLAVLKAFRYHISMHHDTSPWSFSPAHCSLYLAGTGGYHLQESERGSAPIGKTSSYSERGDRGLFRVVVTSSVKYTVGAGDVEREEG